MPSTRLPTALRSTAMVAMLLLLPLPALAQNAPVTTPAAATVIDGWGPLKFGMTMEQAAAAVPNMPFLNPCPREQLAKDGCIVSVQKKGAVTIVGLPLTPLLDFDRFDRLYGITLIYDGNDPDTCTAYLARVIAALEAQYGVLQDSITRSPNWEGTMHKSAGGSEYFLSESENGLIRGFLTTDIEAYREASKNSSSRADLRAARPFLEVTGRSAPQDPSCTIIIRYIAATMPQVNQGAASADNAKF